MSHSWFIHKLCCQPILSNQVAVICRKTFLEKFYIEKKIKLTLMSLGTLSVHSSPTWSCTLVEGLWIRRSINLYLYSVCCNWNCFFTESKGLTHNEQQWQGKRRGGAVYSYKGKNSCIRTWKWAICSREWCPKRVLKWTRIVHAGFTERRRDLNWVQNKSTRKTHKIAKPQKSGFRDKDKTLQHWQMGVLSVNGTVDWR